MAVVDAETAVRAGTYPEFQDEAATLYARIRYAVGLYDEPVDFGASALDIGSRDGRYQSLIRALGPRSVTAVEPDRPTVRRGVREGILQEHEVFDRTLQEWVAGNTPVDSVFAFNVLPRLVRSPDFLSAVRRSVAVGGLALVSFMELGTNDRFLHAMDVPQSGFRPLFIPRGRYIASGIAPPSTEQPRRNNFLSIWRREG